MPQDHAEPLRAAILGTVLAAGPSGELVEPAGVRGKTLVATLALAPGTAISVGQLADDIWAGEPPRDPRAALQTLVSRLRRTLAPGLIESTAAGYRLAAAAQDTDLGRAEAWLARGRTALARGLPTEAIGLATAALGLERGDPGTDLGEADVAGSWPASGAVCAPACSSCVSRPGSTLATATAPWPIWTCSGPLCPMT